MSRRKGQGNPALVHVGAGFAVHPTYARWFNLQPKPRKKPLTVRDLFK